MTQLNYTYVNLNQYCFRSKLFSLMYWEKRGCKQDESDQFDIQTALETSTRNWQTVNDTKKTQLEFEKF